MSLVITGLDRDEVAPVAMGGTELMATWLSSRIDPELLSKFQIIRSRVREISSDKIPILWLHDLPQDPESQHLKTSASRDRFAALVFVSHWQQQMYNLINGVPYSEGVVLQNAIEPFKDHELVKPDATKEVRLIYHTTPHRGLEILVPVFEELAKKYPNIHLDVYSSFKVYGWEIRDEPYKPLFERCKAHPRIHYHGAVSNDEVRKALARSHIYAYPSIWPETSCISAIEAAAARNIVVCPNYAALPETMANWATMYSWTENINEHANRFYQVLDATIADLMANQALCNLKTSSQKRYFDQFYALDYRAIQWEAFLSSLLERSSPSRSEPVGQQDQ